MKAIYHNDGGVFRDVTAKSGIDAPDPTWHGIRRQSLRAKPLLGKLDYCFDNDGWKDIFVTRGPVQALAESKALIDQPDTIFRNLGDSGFQALTDEAGLTAQPPARRRGSAVGDFDGDGRLDVVATALSAPAEIWMYDSPGAAHWLELKLEGTSSNRDGIGARIKITSGGPCNTTMCRLPQRMLLRAPLSRISCWARHRRPTLSRFIGRRE